MPVKRPADGVSPQSTPKSSKTDPQTESDCKITDLDHDSLGYIFVLAGWPSNLSKVCKKFYAALDPLNILKALEQHRTLHQINEKIRTENPLFTPRQRLNKIFYTLLKRLPRDSIDDTLSQRDCFYNPIITSHLRSVPHNLFCKIKKSNTKIPFTIAELSDSKTDDSPVISKIEGCALQSFSQLAKMADAIEHYENMSLAATFKSLTVNKLAFDQSIEIEGKYYLVTDNILKILKDSEFIQLIKRLPPSPTIPDEQWYDDLQNWLAKQDFSEFDMLQLGSSLRYRETAPYLSRTILQKFTGLQCLVLDFQPLIEIPDWIDTLAKIQKLFVIGTRVNQIPKSLVNLELSHLDLRQNAITHFPIWLGSLEFLNYLRLEGNPAFEEDQHGLLTAMKENEVQQKDDLAIGRFQANHMKEIYKKSLHKTSAQTSIPNIEKGDLEELQNTVSSFNKEEMGPELQKVAQAVTLIANLLTSNSSNSAMNP